NAPNNARAFARLAALFRGSISPAGGRAPGRDHTGYARALTGVIAQGQKVGHVDPRWLAALGQLEVEALGRMRDGVVHLQRATQMDPDLFETRYELANAFARMSANDEATRVVMAMIVPSPRPILSIADPAAALAL